MPVHDTIVRVCMCVLCAACVCACAWASARVSARRRVSGPVWQCVRISSNKSRGFKTVSPHATKVGFSEGSAKSRRVHTGQVHIQSMLLARVYAFMTKPPLRFLGLLESLAFRVLPGAEGVCGQPMRGWSCLGNARHPCAESTAESDGITNAVGPWTWGTGHWGARGGDTATSPCCCKVRLERQPMSWTVVASAGLCVHSIVLDHALLFVLENLARQGQGGAEGRKGETHPEQLLDEARFA